MAAANNAAFYREQAQTMRDQAEAAVLDNVRDRCLRSAAAWTDMAERADRTRQAQERTAAAKAALAAAEQG